MADDAKPFDISQDPEVVYAVQMILAGCLGPSHLGVVRTFAATFTAMLSAALLAGYSQATLLDVIKRSIAMSYDDANAAQAYAKRQADPDTFEREIAEKFGEVELISPSTEVH